MREDVINVQIKLSLRKGRDDDLIEFFDNIPSYNRARYVMIAMRSGNIQNQIEEEENIDELLNELFF